MTLLIDIAHMVLAMALSFLGLGYERAEGAQAVQVAPAPYAAQIEGALLSPQTLSVSVQNAQTLCAPNMAMQAQAACSEGRPLNATAQIIIINDCETIPNRPALPTL